MSGRVIQALRSSVLARSFAEAELQVLANCGRIESFAAGDPVIPPGGRDERLFLLQEGEVQLKLAMVSDGGQCGGESAFGLTTPGETFGWGRWVRPDRIGVEATAETPTTAAVFDLEHLGDAATLLKVSQRMVQLLYGRLQEGGICPPDVQGLLKWQHLAYA
jgi:CRP-like cAMP-binding protein